MKCEVIYSVNVLEMRGICKYFGSFCANYDVNFDLRQGEIHAILGENGAGKSTLMNSLYGLHSYDAGTVTLHGKEVRFKGPGDAIAHGIGMVHQHFALIPQLTVTDNVFLGLKEAGFLMDRKKLDAQVQALNDEYRFNVDPKACIWQLPVGVQQKVEILKLLMRKAKILILDEPTAVLTPQEVTELFESLKTLTAAGCSVILITHKIEDVIRYCDRVTVLRDGKVAGNVNTSDTNKDELANMMVGRDVFLDRKSQPHPFGDVLFRAENICADNNKGLRAVKNVSFEIRAGEILGIAGVDGNGQLELGEALTGLRRHTGSVSFADGEKLTKASPREMIEKGLGHIPDDRHKKGLVLQMSVKDNLLLASQRKKTYAKGIFTNRKAVDKTAERLVEEFDIRPRDINKPTGEQSGGNRQKVIVARELSRGGDVLIALQPTRGLDVGAIEYVWKKIVEARDAGKAVLLISTDLDEIYSLSDTIAVMFDGELKTGYPHDIPVQELGLLMAGGKEAAGTGASSKESELM